MGANDRVARPSATARAAAAEAAQMRAEASCMPGKAPLSPSIPHWPASQPLASSGSALKRLIARMKAGAKTRSSSSSGIGPGAGSIATSSRSSSPASRHSATVRRWRRRS